MSETVTSQDPASAPICGGWLIFPREAFRFVSGEPRTYHTTPTPTARSAPPAARPSPITSTAIDRTTWT